MAQLWKEEQKYLIDVIPKYREAIRKMEIKEARKYTKKLAVDLHQSIPELQHRTVTSIEQRLPYLDNLLAGVWGKHNYAGKDQDLFLTLPRENNDQTPNHCNTRHSYNGAI